MEPVTNTAECPLCGEELEVSAGATADRVVDAHIERGCEDEQHETQVEDATANTANKVEGMMPASNTSFVSRQSHTTEVQSLGMCWFSKEVLEDHPDVKSGKLPRSYDAAVCVMNERPKAFFLDDLRTSADAEISPPHSEDQNFRLHPEASIECGGTAWDVCAVNSVVHNGISRPAYIVACQSQNCVVVDAFTGKELSRVQFHGSPVKAVTASLDGSIAASGCWGQKIVLWNPSTGEELQAFNSTGHIVNQLALADSNSRLFMAAEDVPSVLVFDVETKQKLEALTLETNKRGVQNCRGVHASEDGSLVVAALADGRTVVFDTRSGDPVVEFAPDSRYVPTIMRYSAALSPDLQRVGVAGAYGNTAAIFDLSMPNQMLFALEGHGNRVSCLSWLNPGEVITAGDGDSLLHWYLGSSSMVKSAKKS